MVMVMVLVVALLQSVLHREAALQLRYGA